MPGGLDVGNGLTLSEHVQKIQLHFVKCYISIDGWFPTAEYTHLNVGVPENDQYRQGEANVRIESLREAGKYFWRNPEIQKDKTLLEDLLRTSEPSSRAELLFHLHGWVQQRLLQKPDDEVYYTSHISLNLGQLGMDFTTDCVIYFGYPTAMRRIRDVNEVRYGFLDEVLPGGFWNYEIGTWWLHLLSMWDLEGDESKRWTLINSEHKVVCSCDGDLFGDWE
jgi:hypothetical protein